MSIAAGGYGVQTKEIAAAASRTATSAAPSLRPTLARERGLMRRAPASRGSIAAQAMSTRKLSPITMIAISITQFSTTRVSRLEIDCRMSRPSPGRTNTFSTTIAPAIRLANCRPMMVRMGTSALGSACRQSAARRDTPFARAVRMKSSPSASSTADRVTRVRIAACTTPSAIAGRTSAPKARIGWSQPGNPPAGTIRKVTAKTITSRIASQKFGTARPIWLMPITIASPVRPRRSAA